jgi:hypothetical protein
VGAGVQGALLRWEALPKPVAPSKATAEIRLEKSLGHWKSERILDSATLLDSKKNAVDPFFAKRPRAKPKSTEHTAFKRPQPLRAFNLRGTVSDRVATLIDSAGTKHLLRKGEKIGSATLIEIDGNRVRMRDEAGTFELVLEP